MSERFTVLIISVFTSFCGVYVPNLAYKFRHCQNFLQILNALLEGEAPIVAVGVFLIATILVIFSIICMVSM